MNALTEMHKSRKTQRFHPLRRQIAAVFIGFLLLSLIAITMINGLFLEKYYIHRRRIHSKRFRSVPILTVHGQQTLQMKFTKKVLRKTFPGQSLPGTDRPLRRWGAMTLCLKTA